MFKLNPAPEFDAPVPLSMPGVADPVEVQFRFRNKDKDNLAAWIERATTLDAALLHEVIVGWAVKDDLGADQPYNLGALQQLLRNYPAATHEIFRSYVAESAKSKRKN